MRLIKYPSKTLLRQTTPLRPSELKKPAIIKRINDMMCLMDKNGGVGIAAPQIGWLKSVIIVGSNIIINPLLIDRPINRDIRSMEGCLSLPNLGVYSVARYSIYKINYVDKNGNYIKNAIFEGFASAVLQHEMDHLRGITLENNMFAERITKEF